MTGKEKTKFRATKEWKAFRVSLIKDRGSACEICGIPKKTGLNVHHHDESDYTNLDPKKFSVLCKGCHETLERFLRRKTFSIEDYAGKLAEVFYATKAWKK